MQRVIRIVFSHVISIAKKCHLIAVKIPNPCFWMKKHIIMHACLRNAHKCCVLDCKTCGNFDSGVCLRPSRRTHGSGTLFPDFFSLHGIFIFDMFFGFQYLHCFWSSCFGHFFGVSSDRINPMV